MHRHANMMPGPRRWMLTALCVGIYGMIAAPAARGQSVWELTPYRIHVIVAVAHQPQLSSRFTAELTDHVTNRADAVIGAPWHLEVHQAGDPLARRFFRADNTLAYDDLPIATREADKVIFLGVSAKDDRYEIAAREFDLPSRLWGQRYRKQVDQRAQLLDEAFRACWQAFSPVAKIDAVEGREARVRVRAGSLPMADKTLALVIPGDILRRYNRYRDREGNWAKTNTIEWTYLFVESLSGAEATCRIHTALRSPLSARRRGRREPLAMIVRPPRGETRLELRGLTGKQKPLVGYEVFAYGADSKTTHLLGRSDRLGQVIVPADASPLRLLVIRHGGAFLARLPVVPGLQPTLTAHIPDDDARLAAEGYVFSLQERMVDLISQRQILLALIRLRIEEGKAEEARSHLDKLRRLRTRGQLMAALDQQERTLLIRNTNRRVEAKIKKLFGDTRKILNRHLDPRDIAAAEKEIRTKL